MSQQHLVTGIGVGVGIGLLDRSNSFLGRERYYHNMLSVVVELRYWKVFGIGQG